MASSIYFSWNGAYRDQLLDVARASDPYRPGGRRSEELADLLWVGLDDPHGFVECVSKGVAILTDLPVDTCLPASPMDGKRVTKPANISEAVLNAVAAILDQCPVAFHNEKDGELIHQISPVPGCEASNSNRGSDLFDFHIEAPHHETPPDTIALIPLKNHEKGRTSYVLLEDVISEAPDGVCFMLTQPKFGIRIGESFGHDKTFWKPIIEYNQGDPLFRVDLAEMYATEERAKEALLWLRDWVSQRSIEVELQPGQCMVINNRKAAHGRVGFTPDFSTGDHRWLQRMYMTKTPEAGVKADHRYPHVWDGG